MIVLPPTGAGRVWGASLPLAVAGAALLWQEEAFAQIAEDNLLDDGVVNLFETIMRTAQGNIATFLERTFWLLATIEFAFSLMMVALHDEGLQGIFRELVTRILFIGFFLLLLRNGIAWTDGIIDTMTFLGNRAVPGPDVKLTPDGVMDLALDLFTRSRFDISLRQLGTGFVMLFGVTIAFVALLVIAGNLALVLIEFYIVGYGGIVLLALGGSRWTSDYAVAYLKYSLAIGMKLFVMYLIVGVGHDVLVGAVSDVEIQNSKQAWTLAAFCFVLALVASRAPDAVMGLLHGVTHGSSISATQALRASSTAVAAPVSGAAASASALRSAGGVAAAGYQAGRVGAAQEGSTSRNAVTALAKAALADVRATSSGSVFPGAGTRGGRMAADLSRQRAAAGGGGGRKS